MKRLNKKGFTLVELLAVIVILAIILLIAVPSIMGVVDGAKKDAYASSVMSIINAAELKIGLDVEGTLTLPAGGETIIYDIQTLSVDNVDVIAPGADYAVATNKGKYSGYVVVRNSALANATPKYVYYAFITNGNYAVNGYKKSVIKGHVDKGSTIATISTVSGSESTFDLSSDTNQLTVHTGA